MASDQMKFNNVYNVEVEKVDQNGFTVRAVGLPANSKLAYVYRPRGGGDFPHLGTLTVGDQVHAKLVKITEKYTMSVNSEVVSQENGENLDTNNIHSRRLPQTYHKIDRLSNQNQQLVGRNSDLNNRNSDLNNQNQQLVDKNALLSNENQHFVDRNSKNVYELGVAQKKRESEVFGLNQTVRRLLGESAKAKCQNNNLKEMVRTVRKEKEELSAELKKQSDENLRLSSRLQEAHIETEKVKCHENNKNAGIVSDLKAMVATVCKEKEELSAALNKQTDENLRLSSRLQDAHIETEKMKCHANKSAAIVSDLNRMVRTVSKEKEELSAKLRKLQQDALIVALKQDKEKLEIQITKHNAAVAAAVIPAPVMAPMPSVVPPVVESPLAINTNLLNVGDKRGRSPKPYTPQGSVDPTFFSATNTPKPNLERSMSNLSVESERHAVVVNPPQKNLKRSARKKTKKKKDKFYRGDDGKLQFNEVLPGRLPLSSKKKNPGSTVTGTIDGTHGTPRRGEGGKCAKSAFRVPGFGHFVVLKLKDDTKRGYEVVGKDRTAKGCLTLRDLHVEDYEETEFNPSTFKQKNLGKFWWHFQKENFGGLINFLEKQADDIVRHPQ